MSAGDITAYVVDINGCQDSIVYTVEPQLPVVVEVLTYNVNCAGGLSGLIDVEVTQGQSPFSYDWSNGEISQDLSGIAAGTYTLTVIDSLGCTDTISVIITEPDLLIMTVDTVIDATCSGVANGAITVQAQGGTAPYNYSWPSLGETGPSVSGLEAGVYEVESD